MSGEVLSLPVPAIADTVGIDFKSIIRYNIRQAFPGKVADGRHILTRLIARVLTVLKQLPELPTVALILKQVNSNSRETH